MHLRQLSDSISQTQVVEAVGGTSFTGNWRHFRRFLQDTRDLLAQTSLGDPFSTRSHFDARVVATLAEVEQRLLPLRCTEEQTANEVQANLSVVSRVLSDREQLEEALGDYGQFVSAPRTLLTAVLGITALVFGAPWLRKLRRAYRRKAKRHGVKYKTKYSFDDKKLQGSLFDINCFGAKLRHDKDGVPAVESQIDIFIGGRWQNGTVMWVNTHFTGIQFSAEISHAEVALVRGKTSPTNENDARPGVV